jgi:hypothetical protein
MSLSIKKTVPQDSKPSFLDTQHRFTDYIRNPESAPAPSDIELRRMNIYRDLFFNNISNFLADNFPVLKQITPEKQWLEMVRDFFSKHPNQSPYFSEIAEEFISYIQNERTEHPLANDDYPFLLELAHYEWVELAVSIAEDSDSSTANITIDDLEKTSLRLATTAFPLVYQYPVHKISPDFIPTEAPQQPTFLVVYRDQNDNVGFLETNATTHQLITTIAECDQTTGLNARALLENIAATLQHPNPDTVIKGGFDIIEDLIARGILVAN